MQSETNNKQGQLNDMYIHVLHVKQIQTFGATYTIKTHYCIGQQFRQIKHTPLNLSHNEQQQTCTQTQEQKIMQWAQKSNMVNICTSSTARISANKILTNSH